MQTYRELGRIGQKRFAGRLYEEFLPELRGNAGIAAYREMADNDDMIGPILFAVKLLMRQVSWNVRAAGDSEIDRKAADFVDSCRNDMQQSWGDTISEILSFLTYGWSYHEIVYKRRMGNRQNPVLNSKYSDGLIGWQKLPIRSQDTLFEWVYDENDNLRGMTQLPPPHYRRYTIPIEKALHFVTESSKNNPEGRSILRNAYRAWYFKKRIQEIEGIGLERDLAGFPVIYTPEGTDIWSSNDEEAKKALDTAMSIVTSIKRDSMEGVVLPYGWKLELLSTGGQRQFDTNQIIERYDKRIAMSVLADFILLGHSQVGSFALSSDKTKLFAMAIGSFLDTICEVFNMQGIPRLINLNASHFQGITDYPRLQHGDIEDTDIEKLGTFIERMIGVGVLTPDDELEEYIRQEAHLPSLQSSTRPHADVNQDEQKARTAKMMLQSGLYREE